MVKKLNPDIIVITGDVFDQSEPTPVEYAVNALGGLKAKYGTYFVFGNNEIHYNKTKIKEILSNIGIITLVNEHHRLMIKNEQINLVGIDDQYSMNADLPKGLAGAGTEPRVLLAHTPEIIFEAAKFNIDLVLAGHTHGGQVFIPFVNWRHANIGPGYEQYITGLHRVGKTQMYVNRGLGENYFNIRFLTRPEITVITLYNEK